MNLCQYSIDIALLTRNVFPMWIYQNKFRPSSKLFSSSLISHQLRSFIILRPSITQVYWKHVFIDNASKSRDSNLNYHIKHLINFIRLTLISSNNIITCECGYQTRFNVFVQRIVIWLSRRTLKPIFAEEYVTRRGRGLFYIRE